MFVCLLFVATTQVLYNTKSKYTTNSIIPSIIQQYLPMMHYLQSMDQPGLPTHFAVAVHTGKHTTTYNVQFQIIARSVHHVGMSSATGTTCESKHEDTYIARVAYTKTLRKGCKHSTHCAIVQSQYVCAQKMTRLYHPPKQMAERMGTYNYAPHVSAALGRLYDSAIREGTVQTTRCNHTRECVCLSACTAT